MTDQELREKIAHLVEPFTSGRSWSVSQYDLADQILALIKEPSLDLVNENLIEDVINTAWKNGIHQRGINITDEADKIRRFLQHSRYVKLAKDQSLPECLQGLDGDSPKVKAIREMFQEGWRKVELPKVGANADLAHLAIEQ